MQAIINLVARMKSKRLPGKVMADMGGRPMLAYEIERLARSRFSTVVVTTTIDQSDDPIYELARRMGCHCIRGPVDDLIERHTLSMYEASADLICLAGADDPFMDPAILDGLIDLLTRRNGRELQRHYAKSTGFPLGLNGWAWTRKAMEDAMENAHDPIEREHVVPFWDRQPDQYPAAILRYPGDDLYDRYRVTVDTLADLELARRLHEHLYRRNAGFGYADVVRALEAHPDWVAINQSELQGHDAAAAIYGDQYRH